MSQSFFDREATIAPAGYNRFLVPPAALAVHLSIGQAYAFSTFNLPLTKLIGLTQSGPDDWQLTDVGWTFSIAIAILGISAAVFGRWVERVGPRKSMFVAALCFGSGFIVSAMGIHYHLLFLLYLGYGVLGGCGLGIGYISPVSTLIKWFPDRPGMATGMAIMGFGGGALIAAPLSLLLMDHFKTATSNGVMETFVTMGVIYFLYMMIGVICVRVPAPDWKPAGWAPAAKPKALVTSANVLVEQAWRTPQFWLLWVVLCMNVTAGIGVLSQASPMIQEIFSGRVSASAAAGFVGLLSLFNMAGRFFWASTSDYIGRRNTYTLFFSLGAVGRNPQHVVPSWDLRTLWVANNAEGRTDGSLTPIDPLNRQAGPGHPGRRSLQRLLTPAGRHAIIVAEELKRLDFRDPQTMKLDYSIATPKCGGINHADFSIDGSFALFTCEFDGAVTKIDLVGRKVAGYLRLALPATRLREGAAPAGGPTTRCFERGNAEGARIAHMLAARVRELDPTRPVAAGINGLGKTGPWTQLDPLFSALDVAGYNYELARIPADHERLPARIIVGTESYQSAAFEAWQAAQDRPYVLGDFAWCALDYLGEAGIGRSSRPARPSCRTGRVRSFPGTARSAGTSTSPVGASPSRTTARSYGTGASRSTWPQSRRRRAAGRGCRRNGPCRPRCRAGPGPAWRESRSWSRSTRGTRGSRSA